ncbi:vacuolar protein sorting-associated protein 37A [Thrips palmi]|uniref:Vacuolar protein sorting-associated protein 37A n=1 Tax=Thrips palmi TaxID=161013 RepID=A0A6P8ZLT4_THRPL|nr:vacuolar protein sorting-associated protein 37A [Thrips palmi]XP_034239409.1 vacuolar protein sorting-associated protein 37A [Thrips palmi]
MFQDSEDFKLKRKRQIDTLKIFNDNVQELQPGVEYRVEFWAESRRMAILVQLGPDFPLEKPVLLVSPNVGHSWVDHCGRITAAPGLVNFTQHSDLGRVVHAIVREFELRPPAWIGDSTSSTIVTNAPNEANSQAQAPSSTQPLQQTQLQQMIFPELAELSVSELQALMDNQDRRNEFLEQLPVSRELDEQLDQLMTTVENLAKENLEKQSKLNESHSACEERRQILNEVHSSYEELGVHFQRLADRRTPASIRESLRAATLHADEQSERVAEHFLSGEMNLDQFLVDYVNKRMMSHIRRMKEEKLSQQLRDLLRAGY